MSISYLIVTLALSNIQHDVVVQSAQFMNNSYMSRDNGEVSLVANGNPWAVPLPDDGYSRGARQQPTPMNRPRYITPDELKSLDRLPEEEGSYRYGRTPLDEGRVRKGEVPLSPLYDGTRYYGQGYNPLGGLYGHPIYPGIDPYGGVPYWGSPYERYLPFMY